MCGKQDKNVGQCWENRTIISCNLVKNPEKPGFCFLLKVGTAFAYYIGIKNRRYFV